MATGSTSQLLDQIEEALAAVDSKIEERIAKSMEELHSNLPNLIARALESSNRWSLEEMRKIQEEIRAGARMCVEDGEPQPGLGFQDRNYGVVAGGFEGRGNGRFRKMEMPTFSGLDPDDWILRGEQYFEFHQLVEIEKLQAAVVSMEGDALSWYRRENYRRPIVSWDDMKHKILVQFRPSTAGSLHEQWLSVCHTTTVVEYRRLFIDRAAPLEDVPLQKS